MEYNVTMAQRVTIDSSVFRKQYGKVLEDVRINGTEYEIVRNRIPVARIVPANHTRRKK